MTDQTSRHGAARAPSGRAGHSPAGKWRQVQKSGRNNYARRGGCCAIIDHTRRPGTKEAGASLVGAPASLSSRALGLLGSWALGLLGAETMRAARLRRCEQRAFMSGRGDEVAQLAGSSDERRAGAAASRHPIVSGPNESCGRRARSAVASPAAAIIRRRRRGRFFAARQSAAQRRPPGRGGAAEAPSSFSQKGRAPSRTPGEARRPWPGADGRFRSTLARPGWEFCAACAPPLGGERRGTFGRAAGRKE